MEIYDGLPLGEREACGALQPVDALTSESLEYNLTNQGRDVVDVILGLAVQLGIEQGRRLFAGRQPDKREMTIADIVSVVESGP